MIRLYAENKDHNSTGFYWRKYVHEVLVNRLGGLSLPRKSVVRLTDRPDMTLDVNRGRKTTNQIKSNLPAFFTELWFLKILKMEKKLVPQ